METGHIEAETKISPVLEANPNKLLKTRLIVTAGVVLAISLYVGFRNSSPASMYASFQTFLTVL